MTQLSWALEGKITPEMAVVAEKENRTPEEIRQGVAWLLSVIVILLCGGFVIFDDLIDFSPPDRAWNCSYSHGVKFCE